MAQLQAQLEAANRATEAANARAAEAEASVTQAQTQRGEGWFTPHRGQHQHDELQNFGQPTPHDEGMTDLSSIPATTEGETKSTCGKLFLIGVFAANGVRVSNVEFDGDFHHNESVTESRQGDLTRLNRTILGLHSAIEAGQEGKIDELNAASSARDAVKLAMNGEALKLWILRHFGVEEIPRMIAKPPKGGVCVRLTELGDNALHYEVPCVESKGQITSMMTNVTLTKTAPGDLTFTTLKTAYRAIRSQYPGDDGVEQAAKALLQRTVFITASGRACLARVATLDSDATSTIAHLTSRVASVVDTSSRKTHIRRVVAVVATNTDPENLLQNQDGETVQPEWDGIPSMFEALYDESTSETRSIVGENIRKWSVSDIITAYSENTEFFDRFAEAYGFNNETFRNHPYCVSATDADDDQSQTVSGFAHWWNRYVGGREALSSNGLFVVGVPEQSPNVDEPFLVVGPCMMVPAWKFVVALYSYAHTAKMEVYMATARPRHGSLGVGSGSRIDLDLACATYPQIRVAGSNILHAENAARLNRLVQGAYTRLGEPMRGGCPAKTLLGTSKEAPWAAVLDLCFEVPQEMIEQGTTLLASRDISAEGLTQVRACVQANVGDIHTPLQTETGMKQLENGELKVVDAYRGLGRPCCVPTAKGIVDCFLMPCKASSEVVTTGPDGRGVVVTVNAAGRAVAFVHLGSGRIGFTITNGEFGCASQDREKDALRGILDACLSLLGQKSPADFVSKQRDRANCVLFLVALAGPYAYGILAVAKHANEVLDVPWTCRALDSLAHEVTQGTVEQRTISWIASKLDFAPRSQANHFHSVVNRRQPGGVSSSNASGIHPAVPFFQWLASVITGGTFNDDLATKTFRALLDPSTTLRCGTEEIKEMYSGRLNASQYMSMTRNNRVPAAVAGALTGINVTTGNGGNSGTAANNVAAAPGWMT